MKWILFCGIYIVSILMLIIFNFSNTKMKNTEFLCFSKEHTTIAKGFAMVCVMLCHYMGHFGGGVTIFTPLGGTGVAAFLVLSGYGLNESWRKKRNISLAEGSWMSYGGGYFAKRLSTVFIPYALLETLLLPFRLNLFPGLSKGLFAFLIVQPEFGIKDYLLDIFFIDPLYANGWFLTYIAVWYLVFYIVMRTRDRLAERFSDFIAQTVKWMIMGAVCFYIFVFCREIWAEQALSFAFGILLSEKKDTEVYEKIQDWKISLLLFIIATVFLAFKQTSFIREAPEIVMKAVQLMIKLPYGCVVIMLPLILNLTTLLRRLFEKANGIFFFIGTISFELYLIHGYVLGGCGEGLLDAVIWCILAGIISVGFAWMNQRIRTVALYKQK